jgi:hypothetical protein
MTRYVILLRGINVGGTNLIKMPALKAAFEANGFENVFDVSHRAATYRSTRPTRLRRTNQADREMLAQGVRPRADGRRSEPEADAGDRRPGAEGLGPRRRSTG